MSGMNFLDALTEYPMHIDVNEEAQQKYTDLIREKRLHFD